MFISTVMIFKKTLSALAAFCVVAVSAAEAQNVRFSSGKMPLREALRQVEQQGGKTIAFNENILAINAEVRTPSGEMSMEQALDSILSQVGAAYNLNNGQIVIIPAVKTPVSPYTGRIFDNDGEPLAGASVISSDGQAAIADLEGRFSIEAGKGARLTISFIGCKDKVLVLGDRMDLRIYLEKNHLLLDDAIVIGYGSVKRKDLTTAVSIVSTKDLDQRPLVSAASALQGKAAGVQVIQPSGMPGTALSVRVRGSTSVQASNEPLYVVDGMLTDDISTLTANDIASIQILKDASSSAIYGARAANGVVLITTRRGEAGKMEIKFDAYGGFSRLGRKIDALNTEQYKELMAELADRTVTVPSIPASETRYTDWSDVLFGTGSNQNYQLSLTNGSDVIRYHISAGHTREDGIVDKAYFNRSNFRANIDSDLYPWLSISLNTSYSHNRGRTVYENRSSMRAGSILSAINTPPFMQIWDPGYPSIYDEDAYGSRILNPMAANAADMTNQGDRINGALIMNLHPFKNFNYRLSYSMDMDSYRSDYYLDPTTTSDGRMTKGYVSESLSKNQDWMLENIVTYEMSAGLKHSFTFMTGSTLEHAQWNGNALAGYDLPEAFPSLRSVGVANQLDEDATWSGGSAWSLASFLGRITYNFADRYLLTLNYRADGSSRFAPGHRWGSFPSASAAWRLSNENFMLPAKSWLDDLRLRAGWGINGNQGGIGNYSYLAHLTGRKVLPNETESYPGLAISPNTAANPELTWEKTIQTDLGLEISMLSSRIVFSADLYYKHTRDLLLTVALPDNVNLPGGITRNDGEMVNKGVEFELSTKNLNGEFRWDTDFNISFNRNKVTKLGLGKVYYYAETYTTEEHAVILREGIPLGSFFGYKSLGVNTETGDIDYEDISGNGSIGPEDRTIIGCAQPDFIYGMTNTMSWKGWSLSLFLQGSHGNDIFNASRIDTEGMVDFKNQSTAVLRRWKRPGMETDIPRSGNVENIHNSSRFVEDGSYLRLKSLTLSYDFDKARAAKIHLKGLRFYVTGHNLLTFTKYSGYDPEVNAYGSNSVALGVDYGTYPQSKSVIFGVNITL